MEPPGDAGAGARTSGPGRGGHLTRRRLVGARRRVRAGGHRLRGRERRPGRDAARRRARGLPGPHPAGRHRGAGPVRRLAVRPVTPVSTRSSVPRGPRAARPPRRRGPRRVTWPGLRSVRGARYANERCPDGRPARRTTSRRPSSCVPSRRPPQSGWRKALFVGTGGLVNPGESPADAPAAS